MNQVNKITNHVSVLNLNGYIHGVCVNKCSCRLTSSDHEGFSITPDHCEWIKFRILVAVNPELLSVVEVVNSSLSETVIAVYVEEPGQ